MLDRPSLLLDALREAVGEPHVLTAPSTVAPHLAEWRGLYRGTCLAVVRPGTTAEVAAVVRACAAARAPIVPQGGNTGLVGGGIAFDAGAVVLSLTRLNRLRAVDAAGDAIHAEAGATLKAVQDAAEGADRLFPLSLASEGSATVGGALSTNAGGTAVLAYGSMRDLVLGVEAVLADGRVLNLLSSLRKDNTGYDLPRLFCGAEGTLGVVTAASLRLFPRPRAAATALVGLPSPEAALALFGRLKGEAGAGLTTFELMPRIGLDMVVAHAGGRDPLGAPHPWYALVEVTSPRPSDLDGPLAGALGLAIGAGEASDAALAASGAQRAAFWRLRESLSEAQGPEGGSIKHDVSVPVAAVPAFIAEASAAALALVPGCRPVPFGHVGDGNVHFNVSQPVGADRAAYLARWEAMNAVVHAVVARHGGSISAEHGIGVLKRDLLAATKDPAALDAMRAIKAALDPLGIMNPGKVL